MVGAVRGDVRGAGAERVCALAASPEVQAVVRRCSHARGGPWLVGGALRDALLGREPGAMDVLASGDVLAEAPALANELGARLEVWSRPWRLVALRRDERLLMTFARLAPGEMLEENLGNRDYTANALALDLPSLYREGPPRVVDVTKGAEHVASGQLRPCRWQGLLERPVEILRGIRLEEDLGLRLPSVAGAQVRAARPKPLGEADGEAWEELFGLLERGTEAVEARLVEFAVAERVFALGAARPGVAEAGPRLATLRELAGPGAWARDAERRAAAAALRAHGAPARFLLLAAAELSEPRALLREAAEKGASDALLSRLAAVLREAASLRAAGYPFGLGRPDGAAGSSGSARAAAALALAAAAVADCRAGRSTVPAGPDAEALARRALALELGRV